MSKKQRLIAYNSQRDNYSFRGKFSGFRQCFSTCAWMFMSYYSKRIQAQDDKQLAWYVDQVEATVGAVGIAEKIRQRYQYIKGKTSQWWLVQKAGIEFILKSHSVKGHCVFSEKASWQDLDACLKKGPVIVGTKKLGGLAGGHIILIVDTARNGYIANDPFGDGLYSNYQKTNGHGVFYGKQSLAPFAEIAKGKKLRIIYWNKK